MRRYLKGILVVIITVILITSYSAHAADIDLVKHQQIKAQVYFFRQALDELGAASPLQAAELWAKGEQTRNGVYQYAVSCDELKSSLIKKWGKADDNFWIIGGSSPWVSKIEIVKNTKINDETYEITIKYYWATSAGNPEPTYDILTIVKDDNYWCVKKVK